MISQPVQISGRRLTLRELSNDDWPAIHAYASLLEVCRFQAWGPNTPEETRVFVEEAVASAAAQPRRRFAFAAVLAGAERAIGVGELNIRDARYRTGEIGYGLHPDFWGQGLATEMAQLLLDYGFRVLRLHRIFATCDPRNLASARVLQKIGMVYEGRMREVMLIRDGWRDSELYAILEGK
jgi:RimJ/RimL family protein N-acetyltransferase